MEREGASAGIDDEREKVQKGMGLDLKIGDFEGRKSKAFY